MPTLLPPRVDSWPPALIAAAKLAGTLVPCGPGLRPAAWPDSPGTRCVAIASLLTSHRAAGLDTAAWIWGAMRAPGVELALLQLEKRDKIVRGFDGHLAARFRLREFRLREDDLERVGPYAVTTPARTVFDLLRDRESFTLTRQVACRLLLPRHRGGYSMLAARLSESGIADRAYMSRRLATLWGIAKTTETLPYAL